MTTLKEYLTADMRDEDVYLWDGVPYENWYKYDFGIYKIDPFRPIYGYPANIITYPYTIPYKDS